MLMAQLSFFIRAEGTDGTGKMDDNGESQLGNSIEKASAPCAILKWGWHRGADVNVQALSIHPSQSGIHDDSVTESLTAS